MKTKTAKVLRLFISGMIIFSLTSCGNNTKNGTDPDVKQFKNDLEETTRSGKELVESEKKELINSANDIIAEFENQLKLYEANLEASGDEMKDEMEEAIQELKADKKELENEIKELQIATKNNWSEMKSEFNHDIRDFKDSFNQFFEDNV